MPKLKENQKTMVDAHMEKAALLEDQNILMLMTMRFEEAVGENAREYIRVRR